MKRLLLIITLYVCFVPLFSQESENPLVKQIQHIKQQQGDSIARCYLDSKKDSLEQKGENGSYIFLWGLLTSNMWQNNPTESLKTEYREYLNAVIDDEIKSKEYTPSYELLSSLWQLTYDYYNMLYHEGDKETTLLLLLNIHRWFEPYDEARNSLGYARSLLDLCLVLVRDMHKYKEGEPFCREYEEISKNVYGEKSAQYAIALYNISILPQTKSEEKKSLLEKAISIYEEAGTPDAVMLQQMKQGYNMHLGKTTGVTKAVKIQEGATMSLEDCSTLTMIGQGNKALSALKLFKEKLGNEEYLDTLKYSTVITLLINAYIQCGDVASAQNELESYNKNIGVDINNIPPEYVQIFFSSAGIIAWRLKNYPLALRYFNEACILHERNGDYGIEYSKVLANIAMTYAEVGQIVGSKYYLDAKIYMDEAVEQFEKSNGSIFDIKEESQFILLANYGYICSSIGHNKEAEKCFLTVINNCKNNSISHEAYVLACNNLSTIYMKQNRWSEGAKLLESLKSEDNESNYLFSQNLALCYLYMKDYIKAIASLQDMNRYSLSNIESIFSNFTGIERENYWTTISKERIFINNLIAYHYNASQAVCTAYNNALFTKGLLINSSRIIDRFVNTSTDLNLRSKYDTYQQLKSKLAYKTDNKSSKDSLTIEIIDLERDILQAVGSLGKWLSKESKNWKDVQSSLEENEIAIEYCYAPQMESYPDIQPYYGAFVLRKDFDSPKLIALEYVDSVENVFDNDNADELFINDLYASRKAVTLHHMLWDKLSPYMKGIKTVYYSPTGLLSNINFEVLHGDDSVMLGEKYQMVRVSSTANIGEVKTASTDLNTSVLYGNIEYDESENEMVEASKVYKSFSGTEIQSELALRSLNERGAWGILPSTKEEIDDIGSLLTTKGIKVLTLEGNTANEESFKTLSGNSPEIIHLATHGFVIDTPKRAEGNKFVASTNIYSQKDSYMMWAGLMLAGGNNIWRGNFNQSNVEDGILTADEISRLDLSNTKLVVLSACETAKGKVDPVDGVYGLQRAFKMAGVGTIVMSLWKVQDDATSMLMKQFYTYLTGGVEKHQALWKAMMDVRAKYKAPYYWAGFVMLD